MCGDREYRVMEGCAAGSGSCVRSGRLIAATLGRNCCCCGTVQAHMHADESPAHRLRLQL